MLALILYYVSLDDAEPRTDQKTACCLSIEVTPVHGLTKELAAFIEVVTAAEGPKQHPPRAQPVMRRSQQPFVQVSPDVDGQTGLSNSAG
jgi:hypothetical protein